MGEIAEWSIEGHGMIPDLVVEDCHLLQLEEGKNREVSGCNFLDLVEFLHALVWIIFDLDCFQQFIHVWI